MVLTTFGWGRARCQSGWRGVNRIDQYSTFAITNNFYSYSSLKYGERQLKALRTLRSLEFQCQVQIWKFPPLVDKQLRKASSMRSWHFAFTIEIWDADASSTNDSRKMKWAKTAMKELDLNWRACWQVDGTVEVLALLFSVNYVEMINS